MFKMSEEEFCALNTLYNISNVMRFGIVCRNGMELTELITNLRELLPIWEDDEETNEIIEGYLAQEDGPFIVFPYTGEIGRGEPEDIQAYIKDKYTILYWFLIKAVTFSKLRASKIGEFREPIKLNKNKETSFSSTNVYMNPAFKAFLNRMFSKANIEDPKDTKNINLGAGTIRNSDNGAIDISDNKTEIEDICLDDENAESPNETAPITDSDETAAQNNSETIEPTPNSTFLLPPQQVLPVSKPISYCHELQQGDLVIFSDHRVGIALPYHDTILINDNSLTIYDENTPIERIGAAIVIRPINGTQLTLSFERVIDLLSYQSTSVQFISQEGLDFSLWDTNNRGDFKCPKCTKTTIFKTPYCPHCGKVLQGHIQSGRFDF